MPVLGTITPIDFAEDEWKKLVRAWQGLKPDQRETLARQIIEAKRAAGQLSNFPAIPGWDDIIKLGPLAARKTLKDEEARRRQTIIRIKTSPTPPEIRALGSVVNAIDDLEDIVTFITLIARLAIRYGPRALQVGGRVVPILARASDVLNLMTLFVQGAAIAAGFQLTGLTGAAVQAGALQGTKAIFKNELWELLRLGTRKRVVAQTLGTPLKAILTRGALLESLQATDTLWGVGISLGAIVGFIQDLGWGLHRAAYGPVPRDDTQLAQAVAADIPPEFVIFKPSVPGTRICGPNAGYTANAALFPRETAGFLTAKIPTITGPNLGGNTCLKLTILAGALALRDPSTDVVAWRSDMTFREAEIFSISFFGLGWSQLLGMSITGITTIPDVPTTQPIPPATIQEFRALIEALSKRPRKRIKRSIERDLQRALRGEPTALRQRLEKEFPSASPARGIGIDRPWDWDPDLDDAAPVLSAYAARALQALPALWLTPERWTLDQHLRAAAAALWAVRWAITSGATDTLLRYAHKLDWVAVRTPYDPSPTTRDLLRAIAQDPRESYALPIQATPTAIRLDDFLHQAPPPIIDRIGPFLRQLPPGPEALLLSNLYHTLTEELLTALNGGNEAIRYAWDPETAALLNLAHHNVWPRPDTPAPALLAVLHRLGAAQDGTDRRFLPPDELRALIRSVGATPLP